MFTLTQKWLAPVLMALLLVAATATVSPAYAITLKQATQQIQRSGGKVVSAQTIVQNGRRVHIIRYVTSDGVVRTARIPE